MRSKQFPFYFARNKLVYFGLTLLILGGFWLGTRVATQVPRTLKNNVLIAGSVEKFNFLASQNSNKCGMVMENFEANIEGERIQGSCCGVMDLHRYQEQVEGLKKFSDISVVPQDPYDIPVSLAKGLFEYQKNITLNEEQQKIYDEATEMSHEGGPCCCMCWRWTAFEGQAKFLITEHNFTADQISEVWDLEDGCGGSGHATEHS